jgi:hypothetical protein
MREEQEGGGASRPGGVLSVAHAVAPTDWALSDKALEATSYLRFLRTKRNKLKVRMSS